MDALTYVIIIVALLIYFVMFNINSISQGFGRVYEIRKKHVVRAMTNDRNDAWKGRGQRFEVFRPKHENPQPSEWYIPLYAFMHPIAVLGLNHTSAVHKRSTGANNGRTPNLSKFAHLASLFGRPNDRVEEREKNEEPWVIE